MPALAFYFLACHGPETGIDHTVIDGIVVIPPVLLSEDASLDETNDTLEGGLDMGPQTTRHTVVSGYCQEFSVGPQGNANGDKDVFLFTTLDTGTTELSLKYAYDLGDTTDTKAPEATRYQLDLYAIAGGVATALGSTTTDGQQGLLLVPLTDLPAGEYAVQVSGLSDTTGDGSYILRMNGFDPNGKQFLVGAYASGDLANPGPPLGGTNVAEFTLAGDTWTGNFEILYIKSVTTCEVGTAGCADDKTVTDSGKDTGDTGPKDTADTADTGKKKDTGDTGKKKDTGDTGPKDTGTKDTGTKDTGTKDTGSSTDDSAVVDTGDTEEPATHTTVVEGADEVYLIAGAFSSLNSISLTAGLFYASEPVEWDLPQKDPMAQAQIVLNTLQGKIIGWQVQEKEPNDASLDHKQISDPSAAQVLPAASGPGFVDVINAIQSFPKDNPKYTGDMDVFALPVSVDSDALITISWDDPATNLDMYLFDPDGFQWIGGWWDVDANPENIAVSTDGKDTLHAGNTYYIGVYAWKGSAGDLPYKIEIEYF